MSHENERWRNLDLLHHIRPTQQLLSLIVLVCGNMRLGTDAQMYADISSSDKNYPRDCSSIAEMSLWPVFSSASFAVSSRLSAVLGRLHEYLLFSPSRKSAVRQPGHSTIAVRVLAAYIRSPPSPKCFLSVLRIDMYRDLLSFRSLS